MKESGLQFRANRNGPEDRGICSTDESGNR